MIKKELNNILEKHTLWLRNDARGERANLRGADLRGADLRGADLIRADLSEADLSRANLRGANLGGADLRRADLGRADLSGAYLSRADLYGTILYGANLSGSDLSESDLRGANLSGAYLRRADLRGADLIRADLSGADLSGVDLKCPITCPEEGPFIGFKKVRNDLIVKLSIPEDAKRSSAVSRKCRCDKAVILSITNLDGTDAGVTEAYSSYDENFVYKVGEMVSVNNFCEDRWEECAPGIHFFITRQEAVDY
jgi:uncharacterized protein YjbI with pentapeptide repeats